MDSLHNKAYYGKIDLQVINNSHTQAFLFLQEHCQEHNIARPRVLEVGCNTGYFSQLLKDHGAFVYGVEPFTNEALENGYVDGLFQGSIEDFLASGEAQQLEPFDAVVMGDVLEHLGDPESVVRQLGMRLKLNGVLIASVPNITHVSVRRMLEDGQWLYRKYGLLDSTHLHFFSRHSLRKLLIRAGFGLERSFHVLVPSFEEYAPALLVDGENDALNEQDHTFQIIVRASKQALSTSAYTDEPPCRILLLSPGVAAPCTSLRIVYPLLHYCEAVGGELRAVGANFLEDLLWADVLVVHRECPPALLAVVRQARALGVSVVYDLDDLLYAKPPWLMGGDPPLVAQTIRHMVATADRVTCATEPLRKELLQLTDTVQVIKNTVTVSDHIDVEEQQSADAPCTFIVASSDTVLTKMLVEPLKAFFSEPTPHKLVVVGPIAKDFLDAGLQTEVHPHCSAEDFSSLLLSVRNGIGLIPLDDSLFSSCKSAIKYYHYTLCGVVTVASVVSPYTDEIQHEKTGLLVENTPEAWLRAMVRLAEAPLLRRLLLARAMGFCHQHASPAQAVAGWKKAFTGLPRPDEKLRQEVEKNRSSMYS